MNVSLQQEVAALIAKLDGPQIDNAICDLTSLEGALPFVAEAYYREPSARRRELLIHCLWQYGDRVALPTLAAALQDAEDGVWKEALDGLVTLGGDEATRVLHAARAALGEGGRARMKREWIDEAIEQIGETKAPGQQQAGAVRLGAGRSA